MNKLRSLMLKKKYSNFYLGDLSNVKILHKNDNCILVERPEFGSSRIYFAVDSIQNLDDLFLFLPKQKYFLTLVQKDGGFLIPEKAIASKPVSFSKYQYFSPFKVLGPSYSGETTIDDSNAKEIYELVKENFDPILDKYGSEQEFIKTMMGKSVFQRKQNNEICAFIIVEFKASVANLLYWFGRDSSGLEVLNDAFHHCINYSIKRIDFWTQESNIKVNRLHSKLGALPSSVKEFIYLNQH